MVDAEDKEYSKMEDKELYEENKEHGNMDTIDKKHGKWIQKTKNMVK